MGSSNRNQFSLQWIGISFLLLAVYLGFFQCCLGADYQACITYGVSFWLVWLVVCWLFRSVFKNRFEFWMHQLVGIDVLLEGFVPFHSGYGFYWCALGFWSVLLIYHQVAPSGNRDQSEEDVSAIVEPSN